MKFEYQDKIDRYIHGQMSADERMAFELALRENEELRDQLEYTNTVKRLIISREKKKAILQGWEDEDRQDKLKAAQISKRKDRSWYWMSGVAAVCVLGYVVYTNSVVCYVEPTFRGVQKGCNTMIISSSADSLNDTVSVDTITLIDEE